MPRGPHLNLRPEQEDILLNYRGGKVGIAAVPGSGKTFTLAHLAARLIYDRRVSKDQEVLVVTFTNSAVNSFEARIAAILRDTYKLVQFVGYRVRTLHALAHDIVRERPALVGLTGDFNIMDEKLATEIQRDIVAARIFEWRDRLSGYLAPDMELKNAQRALERDLPDLVIRFISRAKDRRLEPDRVRDLLDDTGDEFELARFAAHVYAEYQRSLAYRGAVDFDDLVRLALEALERDPEYLKRLQKRWPYILEDEAQDSSRLQEEMLARLSANRNWVRVGDPNQAINTTFTTADPRFLLDFLVQPDVTEKPLSVSGRSAAPIVDLANELVRWTAQEHATVDLRDAFEYQDAPRRGVLRGVIQVTEPGDPQPNPPIEVCDIALRHRLDEKITPDKELELVISAEEFSLVPWLQSLDEVAPEDRPTVAILVPENSRGFKVAEMLRRYGVAYEELLRSTTATREAVTLLQTVLDYLSDPADLKSLKSLYWAVMPEEYRELVQSDVDLRAALTAIFAEWRNIEEFLWPAPGEYHVHERAEAYEWLYDDLALYRQRVRRWLQAVSLPVDQLVLTVAQDIFTEPADIALAHKVAVLLHGIAVAHPDWRLPQFVEELRVISGNQRRFIGFDDAEKGYEPRPGVVTVATMHAAKGLEWDRVYLMAVSSYGFPSAQPYDSFIGERWYVRGSYDGLIAHLNLESELAAQLDAVLHGHDYIEGEATLRARTDYAKERLRLLYVGITRAKRELIVTWNMGRFWQKGREFENQPALPLVVLGEYLR